MRPLELYIHIPFCISKCKYCDFLSAPSSEEERQDYVESLCKDIRSYRNLAEAYIVVSIFIGGGTPSILTPSQTKDIFKSIKETFKLSIDAEITIEMNPGTVDREKLRTYREVGINRLSMGLQSAVDEELKMLGRIHTFEAFLDTYKEAREEGFTNINVDLMSAIPKQTVESYEYTLRTVAKMKPEHISAYSLIIEEGTPFYERYGNEEHQEELPTEEEERRMYRMTKEILEEYGYERYEISNYAKKGYACRHNLGYWNRTEYLGLGIGASSLMDNKRWMQGEEKESIDRQGQMEEFMFLGLRKIEGISRDDFESTFGCTVESIYHEVIIRMKENGLIEDADGYLRLTERGIDLSNYVMSEFLLSV